MSSFDLTGKKIRNTYQRLIQISGSDIVNGTGSLVDNINVTSSFAITSSYAEYAVSASHEIIKEVSSSFADTASYVNPLNQDVQITGSLEVAGSLTAKGLVHTLATTTGTNGFQFQSNQIKPIIDGFISLDRNSNRSFIFSDLGGSRQYLRIDSLSTVDEANITFNEG